jgi:hypothetical protein
MMNDRKEFSLDEIVLGTLAVFAVPLLMWFAIYYVFPVYWCLMYALCILGLAGKCLGALKGLIVKPQQPQPPACKVPTDPHPLHDAELDR